MNRSPEAGVLLACVALSIAVLVGVAWNMARLGSAISREVQHAQAEYAQGMGGDMVETNALLLGHCLRSEMMKSASSGFLHPDTWAFTARLRALPTCTRALPAPPPSVPPVITTPRFRPIVTGAPGAAASSTQLPPALLHVQ